MKVAPEIRLIYLRFLKAGIAFILVLLIGTLGYQMLVEDLPWFDGLYMTFVTVTTIGFEEIIELEGNTEGRIFTILIAFFGIGILTYIFSNVAALFIETDISDAFKKARMESTIKTMEKHYIICGGSIVGKHIARELERTSRPFVIADILEEVIDALDDQYQYGKGLEGDCTSEEFLMKLNIEKAAGIFVTTRDDNVNLVICLTARQLNPKIRIVSHCLNEKNERKLQVVGANRVITPSSIGGMRMASEMVRPKVTNFLDEMLRDKDKNLRIEELTIPTTFFGKMVKEVPLQDLTETLLLAINTPAGWNFVPGPEDLLATNSKLVLMTSPDELRRLEERMK